MTCSDSLYGGVMCSASPVSNGRATNCVVLGDRGGAGQECLFCPGSHGLRKAKIHAFKKVADSRLSVDDLFLSRTSVEGTELKVIFFTLTHPSCILPA